MAFQRKKPAAIGTKASYPGLIAGSAIIDGEIVVPAADGTTDFSVLQNELKGRSTKIVMVAFDLLDLNGYGLRKLPLFERKAILKKLVADTAIRFNRRKGRKPSPRKLLPSRERSRGVQALPWLPTMMILPHRARRATSENPRTEPHPADERISWDDRKLLRSGGTDVAASPEHWFGWQRAAASAQAIVRALATG